MCWPSAGLWEQSRAEDEQDPEPTAQARQEFNTSRAGPAVTSTYGVPFKEIGPHPE